MKKKSQIQMGETIVVIFVFFILIIISLMFYVRVLKGEAEIEKEEISQLRSVSIVQKIMFLPEIQCSEDNIIIDNCADILKLGSAQEIMNSNQLYYFDMLEFSNITITQVYPENKKWEIYFRNTPDFTSKFKTNVPISLYDPRTRKSAFGILTVETWSK